MSIYDTLNKEQKEAVITTEGPLLLLAGAGSGKTRVLTHRIAYLIDEVGVNPWNILAITFTNKAAGEMRERVDQIVGFGADQVWVSTFHSACVRILRRYIDKLGYDNHFTIYDTDDQKTIIKDVCKRQMIDTKQLRERSVLAAISSAKNELISPTEYELQAMGDYQKKKIAGAYKEYQRELKKSNALDFDDLLVLTVELLKSCPEVLNQYQERFRYIMVDEYQDTNTAQFELIRLLADKYRNLCVVGDDDQSIYKFRGANIRNILDYEKVYPEARVIKLEQNYRSTGNILDTANAVIRNNKRRKEKTLWTAREKGSRIHLRQFDNGYEEAEYISDDIAARVRKGEIRYGDCAILYRTNAQSRMLEERLVVDGMPYNVVGGINFYARREIKDILAYLKTIDNGRDDLAVKRIINVPKRGIGNASLDKVQSFADMRGITFWQALEQLDQITSLGRAAARLEPFVKMIQVFKSKAKYYGVVDMIHEIMDTINYEEYLQDIDDEDNNDRMENVEEFLNRALFYEQTHDEISLSEFLEEIALVADIDSLENGSDRILLMTLHSAKGLEFPYVYLAGMEDGLFPSYICVSSDDPGDLEEERRLAYVGITRAKEELTLTYARSRMVRGQNQYNPVSRFVQEIPAELLDSTLPRTRTMDTYGFDTAAATDFRPKAILRPKVTPRENKPYIAQGIGSLNKIAGITRGDSMETLGELEYREGDRVRHMKYGEGTVTQIVQEPRDYKVTVAFEQAGQKIMYASFAKLKKV